MEIYLDSAATAVMPKEVIDAMEEAMFTLYGNAAGIHNAALDAFNAVEKARATIARFINADPEEIYFTSGGTEANNWAIKGICVPGETGAIITSAVEHHAVLNTVNYVSEQLNYVEAIVGVNKDGSLDMEDFRSTFEISELKGHCKLASIMFANNEVGTINPIKEIAEIAHANDCLLHVDAVQAFGKIPIDVKDLGIDLMSVSAHKIGGPKGIGFLYIKNGVKLNAFMHGGEQEDGMRAGTTNVPAIVGFAKAVELIDLATFGKKLYPTFAYIDTKLFAKIDDIISTGANGLDNRLPGHLSYIIPGVQGEQLVYMLSESGVYISSGSACTSKSGKPSHVLTAMGYTDEEANGSIRITFDEPLDKSTCDHVINKIIECVNILRWCDNE